MALALGVELPGVRPPRVACQLEHSHVVDIHTVKESDNNNSNNNNNKNTRIKPGVAFLSVVARMFAPLVGTVKDGEHAFATSGGTAWRRRETSSCLSSVCSLAFQDGGGGCAPSYLRAAYIDDPAILQHCSGAYCASCR